MKDRQGTTLTRGDSVIIFEAVLEDSATFFPSYKTLLKTGTVFGRKNEERVWVEFRNGDLDHYHEDNLLLNGSFLRDS